MVDFILQRLQEAGYDITRKNPFIEPIFVPHSPSSSHVHPYTHIYLRYKQDLEQQNMYYCSDGYTHPFGKTARLAHLFTHEYIHILMQCII